MKGSTRNLREVLMVVVAMTLAILACGPVTAPTKVPPTQAPPPTVAIEATETSAPEPTEAAPTEAPQPTAKPAPKATKPAPAPTQASQGGASFTDDFSDPKSGWGVGSSDTSTAAYGTNEFVIKVNKTKWFSWTTAGQTDLSNIHIEVKAQKLTATGKAAFGVMCDYQDKDNYYLMGFTVDGYYAIIKTENGQDTFLTSTKSVWTKTTAYKLNATSYQIGADCADGQLALYVDGNQVDSVSDSTFTKGDVGLFVNTFDQAKSEVHFASFDAAPMGGGSTQSGQVLFQDNFSDPNSGWDTTTGDNHTTAYGNGDYIVTVTNASKIGWGNAGQTTLADIHVDVTAKSVGAAKDAAFGVVCDYQDTNNFYYLGITSDGYYAIVKVVDNQDTFFTSTKNEWVKTTKFKLNAASYQLGADCANGTLALYVDGKQIDTADDATFTSGDVGLFAGTFDVPNAEVHFSNFVATSMK
jgi:hypothetical protein